MTQRQLKTGYFFLEGLNAFATTYYFYYLYFFFARNFAFDDQKNLLLAAGSGLLYAVAAVFGGKFGQRRGYFAALKLGFSAMFLTLATGAMLEGMFAHLLVMAVCTIAMCFTWPNLEAAISEKESPARLQRYVGIYNLVWAGAGAIAYFTGGALIEHFEVRSIFVVPACIHLCQLAITVWMEQRNSISPDEPPPAAPALPSVPALNPRPIARARAFLQMAWIANPFAYIAINSAVPVIPGLARRLELTPMLAGIFCSVWFFARAASFLIFWLWPGWHYRFRWLAGSYIVMVVSFAAILLAPQLWVLIVAQCGFGFALGLIYYSSLYYSMDVGETKGEHGGFHEAAIGAGNCAGPFVAAMALQFFPRSPQSGTLAVCGLLVIGFGCLLFIRCRQKVKFK